MRLQQTIGLTVGFLLILSLPSSLTGQSTRGGQGTATDQQHRHQHPASSGASVETAKPSLSTAAQPHLRLEDLERWLWKTTRLWHRQRLTLGQPKEEGFKPDSTRTQPLGRLEMKTHQARSFEVVNSASMSSRDL